MIRFNQRTSLLFNLSDLKLSSHSARVKISKALVIFQENKAYIDLLKFNPFLSEQVKLFKIDQAILETAQSNHLNLKQFQDLATLLVDSKVARPIEPLHSSSRFRILPKNSLKSIQVSFQKKFHFQLAEILALISEQVRLSGINAQLEPKIESNIMNIIEWLLIHGVIQQEIGYIYCSAPSRFNLKQLREKSRLVSCSSVFQEMAESDTPIEIKNTSSIYIEDFIGQMSGANNAALKEVLTAIYPFCDGSFSVCDLAREFDEQRGLMERVIKKLAPLLVIIYL